MEKNIYPKISLVTVCYNHEKYIAETIESILSQNYPNLQYIVIDDGSTDNSWEVIKKYKDRLFYCERMDGYRKFPTIALNSGFNKTDGEIMGWLNSDDILLPKSLFTIARAFSDNQNVNWLTGMGSTINSSSEIVNSRFILRNKYDFLSGNWRVIQQESTFFKRSLWEKTGGKLEDRWAFDTELWTRFFKETEHYHLNAPLGAFRKGQQSMSVYKPDSFLTPSLQSLQKMREEASYWLKTKTFFYKLCKIFWPIFYFIPNNFFNKIPLLKKFSYKIIEFSFSENKWKTRKINPFKVR